MHLLPQPRMRFLDANGAPLAGGKLYSYAAGSSTPLATYTDQTGGTQNANPVILDGSGEANVWISPSAYKFVLKDSTGVTLWTVDAVSYVDNGEIITAKLADGVLSADTPGRAKMADGFLVLAKIADGTLAATTQGRAKMGDGFVITAKLGDGAVTTVKIADANVTTAKILDANVTTSKLADDADTTVKISDSNVTTAKIADSNVTTSKILDLNVTTAKINTAAVTKIKLAAQVIQIGNPITFSGTGTGLNDITGGSTGGALATIGRQVRVFCQPNRTTLTPSYLSLSAGTVTISLQVSVNGGGYNEIAEWIFGPGQWNPGSIDFIDVNGGTSSVQYKLQYGVDSGANTFNMQHCVLGCYEI